MVALNQAWALARNLLDVVRLARSLPRCPPLTVVTTQGMGLPADDLCLENAVVLERFSHRFPLVVDPAGQATRFLLNKYKVTCERLKYSSTLRQDISALSASRLKDCHHYNCRHYNWLCTIFQTSSGLAQATQGGEEAQRCLVS